MDSAKKVNAYIDRLDALFESVSKLDLAKDSQKLNTVFSDQNIRAALLTDALAQMLCIRASGLIEVAAQAYLTDYCERGMSREANNFIVSRITGLQNLNYERLCSVLSSFSKAWREAFEDKIEKNSAAEAALNSVVAKRNQLAHGENVRVSLSNIKRDYAELKKVVRALEAIIILDSSS